MLEDKICDILFCSKALVGQDSTVHEFYSYEHDHQQLNLKTAATIFKVQE